MITFPKLLAKLWSDGSSKTLKKILYLAVLVYSRVLTCKAALTMESESPLILTVNEIFSNTEKQIHNGYGAKDINCVVDKTINLFWPPDHI